MTTETKPLTHADVGRATHAQIRALLNECAAWRKVTGYADPEALDFSLGRAGVDYHLNELAGRIQAASAERDAAVAEMNQHAEYCEVAERERAAFLARAEKAEKERDEWQRIAKVQDEKAHSFLEQRDALRAENERLRAIVDAAHAACQAEHMGARLACGQCHDSNKQHLDNALARVGVLRGVLASWMGHAMHSQEERKQAEASLSDPDKAAAERDARLAAEVREAAGKQLVSICSTYGVVVEIQSGLVVVRSADPLRETKAKARDDALQEAVRELERQAQGWRNARTSSDHAEETAEGYDAAAVVVQALLGKAGTT